MGLPMLGARGRGRFKDWSGVIAVGGTAQWQIPGNPNREYLIIQNQDAALDLWVNFSVPANAGQPSVKIAAGSSLTLEGSFVSPERISLFSTGTPSFTAKEG